MPEINTTIDFRCMVDQVPLPEDEILIFLSSLQSVVLTFTYHYGIMFELIKELGMFILFPGYCCCCCLNGPWNLKSSNGLSHFSGI